MPEEVNAAGNESQVDKTKICPDCGKPVVFYGGDYVCLVEYEGCGWSMCL